MKYIKKPVEIEAYHYTDCDKGILYQAPTWLIRGYEDYTIFFNPDTQNYYVKTLEGNMKISEGDWIIQGVNGELYPCKDDIFRKTYDEVE